jgi:hypothetical protein
MMPPTLSRSSLRIRVTSVVLFFAVLSAAVAVRLMPFAGWEDLIKRSPDIVLARCIATPEPRSANGQTWSDIEVLMVLKGETKPGRARLVAGHAPYQQEHLLLFTTHQSNELYEAHSAAESYRIVSLGRYFPTNQLIGKSLDEQIQLLLRHRLEQLTRDLQQGAAEKKRLEEGIKR